MAFGCPFEGDIDAAATAALASQLSGHRERRGLSGGHDRHGHDPTDGSGARRHLAAGSSPSPGPAHARHLRECGRHDRCRVRARNSNLRCGRRRFGRLSIRSGSGGKSGHRTVDRASRPSRHFSRRRYRSRSASHRQSAGEPGSLTTMRFSPPYSAYAQVYDRIGQRAFGERMAAVVLEVLAARSVFPRIGARSGLRHRIGNTGVHAGWHRDGRGRSIGPDAGPSAPTCRRRAVIGQVHRSRYDRSGVTGTVRAGNLHL